MLDPSLAPGYLAWVVNDGRHAHVGVAGGLDPCLRLSELAAAVVDDALRGGRPDALIHYDGADLRTRFRGRLLLRRALAQVRTPAVAEAASTLLRTPFGRAAARHILFGDGSFPDPSPGPVPHRVRVTPGV